MVALCQKIEKSRWFQNGIVAIILLAGVIIGVETYESVTSQYGALLHYIDTAILWIFVVEIVIKIIAKGKKPLEFFKCAWNVFDFLIVLVCFLPIDSQYVAALRLARVLRVMRLVSSLPKLQVLVNALLKSIPSMGYITILLSMLFYIYAVVGTFLFGANDPIHFGNLQTSVLSMFRVVTLEDWTDIMYINMYGSANYGYTDMALTSNSHGYPVIAALFFVSFVLIGTMVIMNLFIGIIMNVFYKEIT